MQLTKPQHQLLAKIATGQVQKFYTMQVHRDPGESLNVIYQTVGGKDVTKMVDALSRAGLVDQFSQCIKLTELGLKYLGECNG